MTATDTIRRYLQLLAGDEHPGHYLELRYRIGHTQNFRARFTRIGDLEQLVRAIAVPSWPPSKTPTRRAAKPTDLYIGCAPRRPGPDGQPAGGGRAAIDRAWTLWVECDTAQATARLRALPIRPSALIRSGSGDNVHAYFALSEPASAAVVEDANRRLAAAVNGDPVCYDAARILRPPCTHNHKHDPPTPVVAEWIEPHRRRTVEQWLSVLPPLPEPAAPQARPVRPRRRPPHHTSRRPAGGSRNGSGGRDPLREIEPAVYVAELLRLDEIPHDHKVSCPLHVDEHPSLHVYPTPERGWFCFSCRRGGSIYDLAAAILGYDTRGRDFPALRAELRRRFAAHIAA